MPQSLTQKLAPPRRALGKPAAGNAPTPTPFTVQVPTQARWCRAGVPGAEGPPSSMARRPGWGGGAAARGRRSHCSRQTLVPKCPGVALGHCRPRTELPVGGPHGPHQEFLGSLLAASQPHPDVSSVPLGPHLDHSSPAFGAGQAGQRAELAERGSRRDLGEDRQHLLGTAAHPVPWRSLGGPPGQEGRDHAPHPRRRPLRPLYGDRVLLGSEHSKGAADPPCQEGPKRLHEKKHLHTWVSPHWGHDRRTPRSADPVPKGRHNPRSGWDSPRAAGRIPPAALPPPPLDAPCVAAVLSDPGSRALWRQPRVSSSGVNSHSQDGRRRESRFKNTDVFTKSKGILCDSDRQVGPFPELETLSAQRRGPEALFTT